MNRLLDLVRRNKLFFLSATVAALALRLYFVFRHPLVQGDTFIYGDIAKNWLNHGIFGITDPPTIRPTLIRLPGYPGFLAVMFSLFGQEHYRAVMVAQALIDTNTCLVIAALALELLDQSAAKTAYLLAALCPFTANYTATPLAETLAIFCTAHALYYGIRGLKSIQAGEAGAGLWVLAGLWTALGIYMRPDDGLVLVPFLGALFWYLFRSLRWQTAILGAFLLILASLGPLLPWAARNWHVFRVFQPLAARYANDPGEFVPQGFNRWVKTWVVDYVSTEEVYWRVPGEALDIDNLPVRAFDSRQQYDQTDELIADYNANAEIDSEMDPRFEALATERISGHPFRYYVWLPALRAADMWLRPRTEILGPDSRWWEFSEHWGQSLFAVSWAALNLLLVLVAAYGWAKSRLGMNGLVLIGFVVIRTAFLSSLENPEPRYVLECFPVVLALAGAAFAGTRNPEIKTLQRITAPK
jgi:4-amino-4-deoxy-L-arabinose transferase-like glycosyltransferase